MPGGTRPLLLSLVVPVHGVEAYLGAFLDSLSAQAEDPGVTERVEVVLVDDGSPDACGPLLDAWAATTAYPVTVLHQANGGLAAARNAGLELARGTFVSFPDPDDLLAPRYLATVADTLADLPEDVAVAAARILLLTADGQVGDTHPLRQKFVHGPVTVDLDERPDAIQLQAASAFLRREVLEAAGLRFDAAVRPNFEDAFLIALLLRAAPTRRIALVPDAHYVYRRRADGSSLVQRSWSAPEKYVVLPRLGYLRLLRTFTADGGPVPVWVQNLVLYDLLFYFREDEKIHSATAGLGDDVCAAFHETVGEIMALLDDEVVAGFAVVRTSTTLLQALLVGYKHPRHLPERVHVHRVDVQRQIAQIRYLHGSRPPEEELRADGAPVEPLHAKTRDLAWFGRVLAHERIVWVPATAAIGVRLGGRPVPLELGPQEPAALEVGVDRLWRSLGRGRRVPTLPDPPAEARSAPALAATASSTPRGGGVRGGRLRARVRRSPTYRALRRRFVAPAPDSAAAVAGATGPRTDAELLALVDSPATRARFGHAWVFMDRDSMAQDNAEHLYRWVRAHRPDLNAWFVLRRDSADWDRLEAEGFRLVDPRDEDHVLLVKNADHRLSSQVDHYVVEPVDKARFGTATGRFTFLQHGVTKDDLSRWLNPKPISLLVTATPQEQAAIAGDHTPYLFTTKEVALTGFPRHDRLLALGRDAGPARWLLVAPTWRRELFDAAAGGNRRELRRALASTDYFRTWTAVLASPEVAAVARACGLRVAFLPHPNLDEFVTEALPDGVERLSYRGGDVQRVLVETGVMVTDYSSLAFEQAFLGRPVVYHQPDGGSVFDGAHIGRRGDWSYGKDGFGPVTETLAELVTALAECAGPAGPRTPAVYGERMARTFPLRDGRSSERVVERVEALTRPAPESDAYWRPRRPSELVPTRPLSALLAEAGTGHGPGVAGELPRST